MKKKEKKNHTYACIYKHIHTYIRSETFGRAYRQATQCMAKCMRHIAFMRKINGFAHMYAIYFVSGYFRAFVNWIPPSSFEECLCPIRSNWEKLHNIHLNKRANDWRNERTNETEHECEIGKIEWNKTQYV